MHTEHLRRALADARAADLDRGVRPLAESGGAALALRPVGHGDRAALGAFFAALSPTSRYRRFLTPRSAVPERELAAFTEVDHRRAEGLLAVAPAGPVLGFAQYAGWAGRPEVADFAIAIADDWQRRGLGTRLGRQLVEHARASGLRELTATTLAENSPARALLERLGFTVRGREGRELELALAL